MAETTITGLPNATTPLDGTERVPMDQAGATKDATTQDIANLAGAAIGSAVAAHVAAADPHPGYLTQAEGDSRYRQSATALTDGDIPAGIARDSEVTAAIGAHEAAADPHSQYLTQAEGDGRYRQSATALSDSDIPAGIARDSEVAAAIGAHEAAADPHPGYLTAAEANAAYVGLSDARLSDAREWTAATIEQAEAEAGTATTRRAFTAQRVRQAIAAWWTSASTAAGRAMVEALDAAAQRTLLGLGTADSPSFTGLTITGTAPVAIPHIHGSIAGNFYVHVRNTSGGPLAAGTAVYATGSVGDTDRITVAACDPTDPLKMPAIAVLEATLANNGDGDAVVLGELRPINTAAYTLGAELYVGAAGALVATLPASGIVQRIGVVARVQSNTGTIVVGIGPEMARVGFTGAYGDLLGLPTLGTAAAAASTDFAPAAQGVTNGNSHNHDGGDGAQIAYGSLLGLPSIPSTYADLGPLGDGLILVISNRGETATAGTNYAEVPVPVPSGSFTLTAVRFGSHIDTTGSSSTTFNAYRRTAAGVKTSVLTGNATLASGASLVDVSANITGGTFTAGDRIGVDLIGVGTGAQGLFAQFLFTRSAI
jgi:hypothetical protein